MKISCLTFHDSSNYGARLQAFALQRFFEEYAELGDSVNYEIINYSNCEKRKNDSVFKRSKDYSTVRYIYKLVESPYNLCKKKKFDAFSKKYMNISKRMYSFEELEKYAKEKDVLIVGSDQVWNLNTIRFDDNYFLKFAEFDKTMSYAASLGCSFLEEKERNYYSTRIEHIKYISVREKSSVELLKNELKQSVEFVPDPTLLLNIEQWKCICTSKPKRKYIFVYLVGQRVNTRVKEFIKQLKKATGLPVYSVSSGLIPAFRDGAFFTPSPDKWVSYLMNAEYVVTNSFHGTIFSINFSKQFFTFVESQGELKSQQNNAVRQRDLLKLYGLEDRLNVSFTSLDQIRDIDYEVVNRISEQLRELGRRYIKKSVNMILGEKMR